MPSMEKNQFLRQFHGSGQQRDPVTPRTMRFITKMRKLLQEHAEGLISEEECAITAATAAAQWEMKKRERRRTAQPSVLDSLILPPSAEKAGV